ncbi:F0F1 ATP synthase subunit B [Aurantimonas sp. A2-1-M11]|uniref:F0F1 ATP synthase subunit B n=1 Tax=Aurantimonas sp. A2-1-M11 TaxID=3113712 RepID=UPI002F95499D
MFVTPAFAQTESPDAVDLPPAGETAELHGETIHVEGEHSTFPPFNTEYYPSQLLWLAITFGIFYLVLKKVILPRIAGVLENRRDRIALDLEAAERMKSDSDEAKAAYEQDLAAARDRAHKIGHEARDSAKTSAEAERKRLDVKLDEELDAAQIRIAAVRDEALKDVGQIAEETADTILREVIRMDVSREDVAGAVTAVRS